MREEFTKRSRGVAASDGFSLTEMVVVVAIILFLAALAVPNFSRISARINLKSAASDLSGLMQQARILAAKNNAIYGIAYGTINGVGVACVDLNLSNTCTTGEPLVTLSTTVTPASGAPTGGSGQPTAYVLVGDTGTTNYDNATRLAYSARGLPCAYVSSTCSTPAGGYFVYYLNGARPDGSTGWAAVVVTRTGRSKVVTWNGSSWN
jgi:prepilin-type N-terminal cleavage/methylation domain-containing protein